MFKKPVCLIILLLAISIGASAQEVEVNRYSITARVDVASSTVDVRAALEISNLAQSAKPKLYLRLTKLAKVSSASVNGSPAQFDIADDRRVTTLNQVIVTPPASIGAGASATLEVSYKIEAPESSPLVHVYQGEIFLAPETVWVPMPSTFFTVYGPTTAPVKMSVSFAGADGFRAASAGALKSEGAGFAFDQPLNTLPLLLAGKLDPPLTRDLSGIKIEVCTQPGIIPEWVDPKAAATASIASQLIDEAGRVIDFLTHMLGPLPAGTTFRVISSARASNSVVPGALVLNEQIFRRNELSASVIETLADGVARLWVDGRVRIRGQDPRSGQDGSAPRKARSPALLRDSLPRYLAVLYLESRFGPEAARAAFERMRWSYTPIAQSGRDAELGIQTALVSTYSAAVFAKGPLVFRLLAATAGRDKLIAEFRSLFSGPQTKIVSAEDLRSALAKAGGPQTERAFASWIDTIIEPDIIVGAPLPSGKPGAHKVNLRNLGTGEVAVEVVATTGSGKQLRNSVVVPSEDIISTDFDTTEKIVAVEVDPDKLIIQTNYDNDAREGDFANSKASAQTLFNESIGAFNKSQYREAETSLRQAVTRDPANPLLHAWLARALLDQKRLDEATAEANLALKTVPPVGSASAWARFVLGQVAHARDQAAEATQQFRRALAESEEAPVQFAVRELLVQAARGASSGAAVDDSVRAYITALDAAIKDPASDKLFALVVKNNLKRFVQGLTVSRPSSWTTEILRLDRLDANRIALDVKLAVKAEGRDQTGTAVYVLYRSASGWMLEDVELFNVK